MATFGLLHHFEELGRRMIVCLRRAFLRIDGQKPSDRLPVGHAAIPLCPLPFVEGAEGELQADHRGEVRWRRRG